MPVAANLIRVAVPEPAPVGATVLAYYYDPSSGVNGRLLAYEYDADANVVQTFQLDLPTLGVFGDFAWEEFTLNGEAVYDGAPGLVFGATTARPGSWFWRPRTGTLASRIIYNTLPPETYPSYISGSFYVARANVGPGGSQLIRLDLDLQMVEVLGDALDTGVANGSRLLSSQSASCLFRSGTTYTVFPLSGDDATNISLGVTSGGSAHLGNLSIIRSVVRLARLVSTADGTITFPWPNSAPWLPTTGTSVTAQYASGHVLASEASGSGRRVILGVDGALITDNPIIDVVVPAQLGISPYHVGIGNLP